MRRREDLRLITGSGAYLADLKLDGMLHVGFIRSDEPHALVDEVRIPPEVAAFTAADLGLDRPMPDLHPHPLLDHAHRPAPLAGREVCYVGEPIAVVVADRPETVADLRDRVEVEYTPLPSVGDPRFALEEDSPPVHLGDTSNRVARLSVTFGDAETALRRADEVVEVRLRQHRGAAVPMETRGVLAVWDESRETLTVWTSTQSPFGVRRVIAEYLSLDPDRVRVVAPDVGGGFGPKAAVYPEEVVVAALAIRLGRPVRWLEGRRENLTCMLQQRDQFWTLRGGFDRNGRILGIEGHVVHDNGAYVPYGLLLPATSLRLISGPYRIESVDVALDSVYTNRVPTSPVRGAGRPHAVFALERLLDAAARALGMDRAEIRRRNLVRPGDMPYQVPIPLPGGTTVTYDSGDYPTALEKALEAGDWVGFEARRREAATRGRKRGLGLAMYVEDTGLAPADPAIARLLPDGKVLLLVGTPSQGQGHATTLAQVAADHLGCLPEQVEVRAGDTRLVPAGGATVASRTAVTVVNSAARAARGLAELLKRLAAELLEASEDDLILADGRVEVRGQPDTSIPLAVLAARFPASRLAQEVEELSVTAESPYRGPAFAYGAHVAEVEVDPEVGDVDLVAYTIVHDCGVPINPMIVNGQIDGGFAHGLGNALFERIVHSPDGQPVTTTLMDYRIPSATDVPTPLKLHLETPSPFNPLGVKGAGEGGTLPVAAAVASALEDALGRPMNHHPITLEDVWRSA